MDPKRRRRLEAAGWRVGSVQDFLGLTDKEMELIRLREALARMLEELRTARGLSQAEVAAACGTSQANVSRMEHHDPTVSLDRLIRTLVGLGATTQDIGRALYHASIGGAGG